MMIKWRLYWIALASALFGVLFWKNSRFYLNKTRRFQIGKSFIEWIMLVLASIWAAPLLSIYGAMYLTKWIKKPAIKTGATFGISILLMLLLNGFLELMLLLGVFSIELLSLDFLTYLKERQDQRRNGCLSRVKLLN